MKRVLITGGPTNEFVDEVMKITNMSTGSLSLDLANAALSADDELTLIVTNSVLGSARYVNYGFSGNPKVKTLAIETTQDMYDALESQKNIHYDVVIHASAVGDYKPEFTFRLEDMADELSSYLLTSEGKASFAEGQKALSKKILSIMEKGSCRVNDDTKISSYEPNLTVKLTLTTKLISNLRKWFPDAKLIGCKLLENVSHEHLIEVAAKLCNKNDMDVIMANDLAELKSGELVRYLVDKNGETGIALLQNGDPSLMEYAKKEWF